MKRLMLGNEAIAQGAYEAGVTVGVGYPGTPSTEILENFVKYDGVSAEWAPNEKVALEVGIGASFAGARTLVTMKHVGVNVAADPLFTVAYTGVNGGLVMIAADDPGMHSSQNEQDTRALARAAHVPVLEPSDSSEAKEFLKLAYELSEEYDTPVIFRTTTRIAHAQGIVEIQDKVNVPLKEYTKDIMKNVMMPGMAIKRHLIVEDREKRMAIAANTMSINKIEYKDKKIGVITSGIPYQYVKDALPNASVLKLGMVNPLPRTLIEEFAKNVETLYLVEELEPIFEEQIKSWGIKAIGKEILTVQGEYSANLLARTIGGMQIETEKPAELPGRPPVLCPGCPHRGVYYTLKKLGIHATGDIGCYTLGALPPLQGIDTCICMGASIGMIHGMEKARGREFTKDWVAIIGDSTFLHTGVNGLINLVYNQGTSTVMILDNSTTGMTGHQEHAATGKTLDGNATYAIDIPSLIKSIGVKHVIMADPFDTKALEKIIKTEVARDEASVIIVKAPCELLDKTTKRIPVEIDQDKCKQCYICTKPGCPAIIKAEDGTVSINTALCSGCELCSGICPFKAIEKVGK
ncbi:MAG: indolepyruvate ferredoxin oxidoreductase, alpha subunit [Clostridiales bacterium]|nr:indolepyruvate ferredoxin oxidoreductase, alpha subunit [Clostridiales bacterium]